MAVSEAVPSRWVYKCLLDRSVLLRIMLIDRERPAMSVELPLPGYVVLDLLINGKNTPPTLGRIPQRFPRLELAKRVTQCDAVDGRISTNQASLGYSHASPIGLYCIKIPGMNRVEVWRMAAHRNCGGRVGQPLHLRLGCQVDSPSRLQGEAPDGGDLQICAPRRCSLLYRRR